jgi:hypothetical protein
LECYFPVGPGTTVRAFGHVASDAAAVDALLDSAPRETLPRLLAHPEFLARVLDRLIADEAALAWFIGTLWLSVDVPYEARRVLRAAAAKPI